MKDNKNQLKEHEFIVDDKDSVTIKDNEMNDRINKLFGESYDAPKKELKVSCVKLLSKRIFLIFSEIFIISSNIIIAKIAQNR